jgi:hypothetical protein
MPLGKWEDEDNELALGLLPFRRFAAAIFGIWNYP